MTYRIAPICRLSTRQLFLFAHLHSLCVRRPSSQCSHFWSRDWPVFNTRGLKSCLVLKELVRFCWAKKG
jgi:hypothetical protein